MQDMELRECIEKIKTGGKEDIKKANKNIEHIWCNLERGTDTRKMLVKIFISEFGNFESIKNESNRLAFISSLKYAFMSAESFDDCFESCKRFVLYCMCNPSGHIRRSMIHASDYLIMFLHLDAKDSDKNRKRFGKFIWDVETMADFYYKKEYGRYKYIESLPPSVFKSLEQMRYDLTASDYRSKIYQDYRNEKLSTVLPRLTFKYTQLGSDTIPEGFLCSVCKGKKKRLGASNIRGKKPKMICEDCAIDGYMDAYGYKTRAAASARRRRSFDIRYLFQDMIVDRYLAENNYASIGELDAGEMENIFMLGKDMYDMLFDRGDKLELEEIFDQKDVEEKLQATLDKGDFDWELFRENM